jgi:hypothetical protein
LAGSKDSRAERISQPLNGEVISLATATVVRRSMRFICTNFPHRFNVGDDHADIRFFLSEPIENTVAPAAQMS